MWLGQYGGTLDLKHFQMLEAHITYALRVAVVRSVMVTKSNHAFINDAQETSMLTKVVSMLERHTFLRVFTKNAHQSQA